MLPGNVRGRLAALAAQARGQGGIGQDGVMPHQAPGADVNSLMTMLRSGKMSADHLMQLLAVLMGQGGIATEGGASMGAMDSDAAMPAPQQPGSQIAQAYGQS